MHVAVGLPRERLVPTVILSRPHGHVQKKAIRKAANVNDCIFHD